MKATKKEIVKLVKTTCKDIVYALSKNRVRCRLVSNINCLPLVRILLIVTFKHKIYYYKEDDFLNL